jgi:glucose-1-phosphate cytidylyltransferase
MKVVFLAGGRGTRLAEETAVRPKPMVEIGGIPLLRHLMYLYAAHRYTDFIVACGYRGEMIEEYFRDVPEPDWSVRAVDTGTETTTAGRILRLRPIIGDETFMVTYGDGLANIDVSSLVAFHRGHGRLATVTAVHPPARFGALTLDGPAVAEFAEKAQSREGWINGGFFVFEPRVFEYLDEAAPLERGPLEQLAAAHELMAFRHEGFWQPMDTLREKHVLEGLWQSGRAPWLTVAGGTTASS